jgi:hypothetical protein
MAKTKASFEPSLPPFRVHAFGAGVQSTSLLYAWALESEEEPRADGTMWRGFFPQGRPDLALYADTQSESRAIAASVDEARAHAAAAGVPFEVVTAGDLGHPKVASTGTQGIFVPLFTVSCEPRWVTSTTPVDPFAIARWTQLQAIAETRGRTAAENAEFDAIATHDVDVCIPAGEEGQLRRQCTAVYKIDPMMKRIYELAGDRPIEVWLGISVDEAERLKTGPNDRVRYVYPLVFNQERSAGQEADYANLAPMNRNDCIRHLIDLDTIPAKSACVFCPYRSEYAWAQMKREDPESFERACEYDERMRDARPGFKCYVHRSRMPLRAVAFQASHPQTLDLFGETDISVSGGCEEGYCGL